MKKILVVSVHPDDETLGCGGTIFHHKHKGDQVYWLNLTSMIEGSTYNGDMVKNQMQTVAKVQELYNFQEVFNLKFPTTKLDTVPSGELIGKISEVVNKVKPQVIYLPYAFDVHSDHRVAFNAAFACTKNFRYPFIERVLMMETLSETEQAPSFVNQTFTPNVYVDITSHFNKKIDAFKTYSTEVQPAPLPRSLECVESLAKLRGSFIGVKYAEAFQLLKESIL